MLQVALAGTPVPAHVEAARSRVDWRIAGDEAVALLSDYLRVDTINPPGNEDAGVVFLGAALDREGIPWERIELAPGRSSLVARLTGTGAAPPLCLLHHIDVVGAEVEQWPAEAGPLSGAVIDGEVWGRGAVDMKGMGAIELLAFAWLKRLGVPLSRDVILLAVADEEVHNAGARQLAERWSTLGCGEVLNEGGFGVKDALFDGQTVHAISVAEKGLLWVRMVAEGRAGHGSVPHPAEEAPARLLRAMEAIERARPSFVLVPAMEQLLEQAGAHRGGVAGLVLRSRPLVRALAWRRLKANPTTRAAMHDTIHLTGFEGGAQPNVVPSRVSAVYDCRLMPGTTPDAMVLRLEELVRDVDGISFEVIDTGESNGSPIDDPLYRAIEAYAVEGRPYAVAGPLLSVGYTDSLLLRPVGANAYGYIPFELTAELAETAHGHGERLPVDQVGEGLRRLFSIVVDVAGTP